MSLTKCKLCGSEQVHIIDHYSPNEINEIYLNDPLLTKPIKVNTIITEDIYLTECKQCTLKMFTPIEGTEDFYCKLTEFEWYYQTEKWEFEQSSKYVKTWSRVLEIGSGPGHFSKYVNNYTGLEFNPEVVKQAQAQRLRVFNQSVDEHARSNTGYDLVVAHQVLEHVDRIDTFIMSAVKILAAEGLLIITVPNDLGFLGELRTFSLNLPPHHLTRWNKQSLTKLAECFQLAVIAIHEEPINQFHKQTFQTENPQGHSIMAVYKKGTK